MLSNFGEGITRHFMYPYNRKFWTMPPEELIPDWTQGYVPRVNLREVIDGALTDKTKPLGYNSEFRYPRRGGIDQIAAVLARNIGDGLKTGHCVTGIDLKKNKIYFRKKTRD
jgi:Protoporphyrinogen oxidase